jgi:formamidopyrimidine-DNA glycosylase
MDQKKLSGIGNYILSEIFYRCKLNPFLYCKDLTDTQWKLLYDQIVNVVGINLTLTHSLTHSLIHLLTHCKEHSFISQLSSPQNKRILLEKYNNQEFHFFVYSRSFCPNGYKVIRETGPHKRTIHYVEEIQGKKIE